MGPDKEKRPPSHHSNPAEEKTRNFPAAVSCRFASARWPPSGRSAATTAFEIFNVVEPPRLLLYTTGGSNRQFRPSTGVLMRPWNRLRAAKAAHFRPVAPIGCPAGTPNRCKICNNRDRRPPNRRLRLPTCPARRPNGTPEVCKFCNNRLGSGARSASERGSSAVPSPPNIAKFPTIENGDHRPYPDGGSGGISLPEEQTNLLQDLQQSPTTRQISPYTTGGSHRHLLPLLVGWTWFGRRFWYVSGFRCRFLAAKSAHFSPLSTPIGWGDCDHPDWEVESGFAVLTPFFKLPVRATRAARVANSRTWGRPL